MADFAMFRFALVQGCKKHANRQQQAAAAKRADEQLRHRAALLTEARFWEFSKNQPAFREQVRFAFPGQWRTRGKRLSPTPEKLPALPLSKVHRSPYGWGIDDGRIKLPSAKVRATKGAARKRWRRAAAKAMALDHRDELPSITQRPETAEMRGFDRRGYKMSIAAIAKNYMKELRDKARRNDDGSRGR